MTALLQLACAALALWATAMAFKRALIWSRGSAARIRARDLLKIPRRYFVDVHHKVARRPEAARMHVLVAGGAVLLAAIAFVAAISGGDGTVARWLIRLFAIAVMAGAILDLIRRAQNRVLGVSMGAWRLFPIFLGVLALGLALASFLPARPLGAILATPLGGAAALALIVGLFGLFCAPVLSGPIKHAFAGLAHLAFHPRPERFNDDSATTPAALKLLDLNAPQFGTPAIGDMPWTRLLSFDACVECGRCQEVCPAFAAGQPLNPKALIQDLARSAAGEGVGAGYAGAPHPGRQPAREVQDRHAPIVGAVIARETLWSCTTCRACVESCPMFIEHVDTIIDLRRAETLEFGAAPAGAEDVLRNLRETGSPTRAPLDLRDRWARNAGVPLLFEAGQSDILLWIGDAVADERSRATLLGLVTLLRDAKVDFAVLGSEEGDTGDLARRLGDEVTFQKSAAQNIRVLQRYDVTRIVTADPHALHCLGTEYPALGLSIDVQHHSTFLNGLVNEGRLRLQAKASGSVSYHDPCYLGRYNSEFEAPRALLAHTGAELREMALSGISARCCGGGGGAPFTDIPGERRIADMRMQDALDTGADTLVVGCPNCRTMLEGASGRDIEVVDLVDVLLAAREQGDA